MDSQKHAYDGHFGGDFMDMGGIGLGEFGLGPSDSQNSLSDQNLLSNSLTFPNFNSSQEEEQLTPTLVPLLDSRNASGNFGIGGEEENVQGLKTEEFNGGSTQAMGVEPTYHLAYLDPANNDGLGHGHNTQTVRFLTTGNLQTPGGGTLTLANSNGYGPSQPNTNFQYVHVEEQGEELELSQPHDQEFILQDHDLFNTSIISNNSTGESQSQNTSGNLPTFTKFPGDYDFKVEPVEKAGKKCVYWAEENKIYCNNSTEIMFAIMVDFKEAPVRALHVDATLYYKDMIHIAKPVERCKIDLDGDLDTKEEGDKGAKIRELAAYVLTCCDPKAEHKFKASTGEYYTSVPLRKPAEGDHDFKVNYKFNCLSSCKSRNGINRRELVLLFVLRDANNKTVGRESFRIKVCKCPARDCTNDQTGAESGSNGKNRKRTKKNQKQKKFQSTLKRMKTENEIPISCRTVLEAGVGGTPVRIPQAPLVGLSPMDSERDNYVPKLTETFTQEQLLSQNQDSQGRLNVRVSGNFLTNIARDIRLALHVRGIQNQFGVDLAESMFTALRSFRNNGRLLRNYYKQLNPDWDPEQDDFGDGEEFREEDL